MTRRHLTTAVTMLVLVGLLVLGAVWGWQSLFTESPRAAEPAPTCDPQVVEAGGKIRSGQVTVSVYNGGTRSGLANQTMNALMARGFQTGDVGNAPSDVEVRKVQVWSTVENDPRARLVARQFGKGVKVRYVDEDLGPGVDVIVGNRFRDLVKAPRALKVKQEQEFCVPVEDEEPLS